MPSFGPQSKTVLSGLHPDLQRICNELILHRDFSLVCGQRGEAEQKKDFDNNKSGALFGQSPHNFKPALAFDFCPYYLGKLQWDDTQAFCDTAKDFKDIAYRLGIKITWGKDFPPVKMKDGTYKDLGDFGHVQLTNWLIISKKLPLVK